MDVEMTASMQVLSRTPPTISASLDGLSDVWLRANERPNTFSPFDVVGHLIDGEVSNWMTRARLIVAGHPQRSFEPFDRFAHWERNVGRDTGSLLEESAALRAANLVELASWGLTDEQLAMAGTLPAVRRGVVTAVVGDVGGA